MVNVDNQVEGWWSREWIDSKEWVESESEFEEEALAAPSLWEAEVAALSDEQLAALEESSEDV